MKNATEAQDRRVATAGSERPVPPAYYIESSGEAARLIPNAQLATIPGASHFALSSAREKVLPVVATFLEEPATDVPFGTPKTGYHPGVTR